MTVITVFLGGYFIIQGEITPGELTIFTELSWALSNPMRKLGNLINDTAALQYLRHQGHGGVLRPSPTLPTVPTPASHADMEGRDRVQERQLLIWTGRPGIV